MKQVITKLLKKALEEKDVKLKEQEIEKFIEIPPSFEMGDYAFPCFFLAEKLKSSPHEIALGLRAKIKKLPASFQDIQTAGPYINFFVDRKILADNLIKEIKKKGENFGKIKQEKPERVMIEFSQSNTHKAFHVGHIRGTSLGESLARILEFCGDKVIRANYQGDTGMHVAKWIWCYQKYHSRQKLKKDESWIASIYVDAVKRLAKNEKLQKEVDEINLKLGTKKDQKLNSLWKKTRQYSLDSLEKIYRELNTQFDVYFFEGDLEEKAIKIVDDLLKNKIAKLSDEAVIIDLKKYNLGVWVLLRKDRTVLYSTKDIVLAQEKFREYKLDKSICVIGAAQSLHMNQLFKTLELMKFEGNNKNKFIPFSEVRLPHGKMSSRTGENILYSAFLSELSKHAKKEIKKRILKISARELEKRALTVSIAAIKYSFLKQNSNRNIIFDKNQALNFEGDTGPYLLYSYARASSILRKIKNKKKNFTINNLDDEEIKLIKKLHQFQEIVFSAYKTLNPSLIANYSYELSKIFNEFYHACPVINSEKENFRISIVESFRIVLKNSLNILGIETLEKM